MFDVLFKKRAKTHIIKRSWCQYVRYRTYYVRFRTPT